MAWKSPLVSLSKLRRKRVSIPVTQSCRLVLGTGGDGSNNGVGIFFEGAITIGNPPDSTDDAVQANIVSAGYGR